MTITGVRRAAQRKLQQELGIPVAQLPLDSFHCVSRIHYLAESDETWGEHEGTFSLLHPYQTLTTFPCS